jgi:hypothetical protein
MKKLRKQQLKQKMDPLIINIIIFLAVLVIGDLFTILYFQNQMQKARNTREANSKFVMNAVPGEYTNPEAGNLKSLKTGGEFQKKMPVFKDALKFKLYYDKALAGPNGLYVLQVCCPAGYSKEFYTAQMPWAFLLYDFEPGLPCVTLFEINIAAKTARFEIVILDKTADEQSIRSVSVTMFIELLKQYLPGYQWRGSVRKEIM